MSSVKRILVVDDEETLTFSLYQTFIKSPIDCEVVTASSGEEALQRFREQAFDVVITDVAMPGISGLELLSTIKDEHPETRVIVITAYGSPEVSESTLERGGDLYVEKPFDIIQLKETVIKMLE
ncbi:MAG: response regulator [Calditrichaeota bacterium]|nr:MAG: response regulator [Calditrichota bacterium]